MACGLRHSVEEEVGACGARGKPRKWKLVMGSTRSPTTQELTLRVGGSGRWLYTPEASQKGFLPCPQ